MPDQDRSAEAQFLYLTTTGRRTGLPREIEIWFVSSVGNYYILSGNLHHAQWVKNIKQDPRVRVRVGPRAFEAMARVLDRQRDRDAWDTARRLSQAKYEWGDGLPPEGILNWDDSAGRGIVTGRESPWVPSRTSLGTLAPWRITGPR